MLSRRQLKRSLHNETHREDISAHGHRDATAITLVIQIIYRGESNYDL